MPYALPLTHVRLEGTLGTTTVDSEVWSFGFYVSGALLPEGYDVALPGIWDAAAAYILGASSPEATFSPDVFLTEVMAASVQADGRLQAGYYSRYAEARVQGTSSARGPWQVCSAVTLDAGKPAAGRFNRFYPPPQSQAVTGGIITAATALARANAARTLVNAVASALEAVGTDAHDGVVASERFGSNRAIADVKVGRVPDTQRRRRNNLLEEYASVAY